MLAIRWPVLVFAGGVSTGDGPSGVGLSIGEVLEAQLILYMPHVSLFLA